MRPFTLAITGPTGSGKTTVASKLAEQIEQCVNIDADVVKHMIVNGFIYGNAPEGVSQWELLGANIGMLAKNFQNAGYSVIISGFLKEPAWEKMQKHITLTHKILLLPHVDTAKQRDAGRHEGIQMGAETISEHHDYFSNAAFYDDFIKLDSTSHSEDETANEILEILKK